MCIYMYIYSVHVQCTCTYIHRYMIVCTYFLYPETNSR